MACIGDRRAVVLGVTAPGGTCPPDECGGSVSAVGGGAGFAAGFIIVCDRAGCGETAPESSAPDALVDHSCGEFPHADRFHTGVERAPGSGAGACGVAGPTWHGGR